MEWIPNDKNRQEQMPVAESEDIHFSMAAADEEDLEAVERSEQADARQKNQ